MLHNKNKFLTFQNIIIFASILPLILFGLLTYNEAKEEKIAHTLMYLQSHNVQKKQEVIKHFEQVKFDVKELAKTISFLEKQATKNIANIQDLQKSHLQNYYHSVANTIVSLAKKDVFQYIFKFLSQGKEVSSTYLDNIYKYKKELAIVNVLMMDADGEIIYSSDDATLLNKNASELTSAFEKTCTLLKGQKKELKASFVTTGNQANSGLYKQYVVAPFKDVDGYIAIEINQAEIQKVIENVAALGKSAETFLIYKYENETFLASHRTKSIKKTGRIGDSVKGKYINLGFTLPGVAMKYNNNGAIELVGYTPVHLNNIILSMQTTVKYTEVISPIIDGSDYFERFAHDYGYKNIMLIGSKGDLFYSIDKSKMNDKDLMYCKDDDTHLVKAINKVFTNKKLVLTDINFHSSCSSELSQYVLMPMINKKGKVQNIVVLELNQETLQKLLRNNDKSYEKKETYIVGEDAKLRTDSFLNPQDFNVKHSYKYNIKMTSESVLKAMNDESGVSFIENYNGEDVLSSFDTLQFEDFSWIILTEIDKKEIFVFLDTLMFTIIIFIFISSVLAFFVMLFITGEKKKQDNKIKYQATHDSLTGLPNRTFALEYLNYILAQKKRSKKKGAVLFIDLDKFKIINDSYGHEAGDFVLKHVAVRLKTILREEDLLARLGGDEFVLVINDYKTLNDINTLCHKMLGVIAKPIEGKKRSYRVGLSIGIATFPHDSTNAQNLLQFADTAMYKTKDTGRNNFTYYDKAMTEKSIQVSRVEEQLKHAIQNNELFLQYQPQVSLASNKVVGVESLVRWNHPTDGLVMPDSFIPLAEESSLILDLGKWVLYEACSTFKKWKNAGCTLEYIAVNLSSKQLQDLSCLDEIQRMFKQLDFDPTWLELEITENTFIGDFNTVLEVIEQFKNIGVKFSMDDFGTGYSSFSYLKSLPISTLKIDRAFIKDISTDKDDRSIVEAMIKMGHTLGFSIVAEGAETKGEIELLRYFTCDMIQGYYYSKPLDEDKILSFIKEFPHAK
ncbi:EAL domain-containing protein [Sulfurimonas sp. SAG-AH-194-I05]|nr:EAL domain-containing protein [Sulfurimonas sp. SAG-AH-194-I05]MDF1874245.1 EAL domain-containing protein [Sulfurimonas sp. SAG-AH-194-I05]